MTWVVYTVFDDPTEADYRANDEAFRRAQEVEELREAIGLLRLKIEDLADDMNEVVDLTDQQNAATREIVAHPGAMRQINERSEGRSTVHPTGPSRREHQQSQNTGDADLGFVESTGALSNQPHDE